MTTSNHEHVDDLVRRLSPVSDADLAAALDERNAERFAMDIMSRPDQDDDGTATTSTAPNRRKHPLAALATASAVVLAVASFAVLPLGSPQPAIAGWGPEPSEPTPQVLHAAARECPPPEDADPGQELFSFMSSGPALAGIDVRGNGAAAVFADDTQYFVCTLVDVDGTWEFSSGLHGSPSGSPDPIDADGVHQWTHGELTLTTVVGHVDGSVERATVQLQDGTQLDATVGDGMFVAWWPDTTAFTRATAYDAEGVAVGTDESAAVSGFETGRGNG